MPHTFPLFSAAHRVHSQASRGNRFNTRILLCRNPGITAIRTGICQPEHEQTVRNKSLSIEYIVFS